MITKVIPPPGVFGFGRSRTVGVVAHRLSPAEAHAICTRLAKQDSPIPVLAAMDQRNTVHVWPERPTTTAEEVEVLRSFAAVTDSRLVWHEAVTA